MPFSTACSELSALSPISINVSDLTIWVEERCTMVTSAPPSQRAAQMSWAELLEPMTTTFLPRYLSGPGWVEECCCSPLKMSWPLYFGQFALPDMPVASTSCLGLSTISSPSRSSTPVHSLDLSSYFSD